MHHHTCPQPQLLNIKRLVKQARAPPSYLYRQSITVAPPPSNYDHKISFFIEDMYKVLLPCPLSSIKRSTVSCSSTVHTLHFPGEVGPASQISSNTSGAVVFFSLHYFAISALREEVRNLALHAQKGFICLLGGFLVGFFFLNTKSCAIDFPSH